jgi:hypothetical protein
VTSREVLDAADVAYENAQRACFAWTVAQAERRADRDRLHAVYLARWLVYVRLVQWGSALACGEQGVKEMAA